MVRYECRSCGRIVTGSAYRSSCPECGGILRNASRTSARS